ncbi:MAG TPA: sulfite exporter TauE/SafE family protein [Phycisphaerales bacterium]|nr:sulfite exporter TauE/SafE family protein [Phycisphaerales bacterium]
MAYVGLVLLGLAVGAFGTLIGAGGGFLLAPVLVLLYPHESAETIASISLAVVFCNALSGTAAYLRQHKVDVRAGLRFTLAAIPGSVLGAIVVSHLPRIAFEIALGVVLVAVGVFLFVKRRNGAGGAGGAEAAHEPLGTEIERDPVWGPRVRHHTGRGMAISAGVGFLSSLLGIGGGIIHVPALVHVLGFPVHVATATSHFVLATTAGAGTLTHVVRGGLHVGWHRALCLGAGAVVGAQIGAHFAKRTPPRLILKGLAVALVLVGLRIAYQGVAAWVGVGK